MTRQQELIILRLWRDWCRLWPVQYGHESLQVAAGGYDPVFDVIPAQTYKDFYHEVVRGHPLLKDLNPLEVIDTALNQVRAPEAPVVSGDLDEAEQDLVYSVDNQSTSGVEAIELEAAKPVRAVVHNDRNDQDDPDNTDDDSRPADASA